MQVALRHVRPLWQLRFFTSRATKRLTAKKKSSAMDLIDKLMEKKAGRVAFSQNTLVAPRRGASEEIIQLVRRIMFPGIFGDYRFHDTNLKYRLGMLMFELKELLEDQVARALLHVSKNDSFMEAEECTKEAKIIASQFMDKIPQLRAALKLDVAASLSGDPAARSEEEIVMCYPGFEAIFIHRIAHEFYRMKVPLIPRMMSVYAHQRTSIDIHPGAQIGQAIFMDHGTGIVIGETTVIGKNVKLFHGVTLGAHSYVEGKAMAGVKRHPTIEDDVTIYAGAVILGGDTVIGTKAVIGGSLWVTSSVPPGYTATQAPKEPTILSSRTKVDPFEAWDPCI